MTDTNVISMPFADQSARDRIAADLDVNLLVEAGAGSGKTTALVGRMVALVESDTATVDEIAAVTFTRKAAGELRERFQDRLEERLTELRSGAASGDDLALERLGRALEEIDRAFIGTIHAFCARLLRERPLEVGLDPGFEELPVEERIILRRTFWRAYLERMARESDPILEDLARAGLRPVQLYGLFDRLVENPDVTFPVDEADPPSASEMAEVRAELEEIVSTGMELMPDRVPDRGYDPLQKKIRKLHFTHEITGWSEPADLYEALAVLCKPGPRGHRITQNRWKDKPLAKDLCARADTFGVGPTPAHELVRRWYAHRYALAIRLARHAAEEFADHRRRTGRLDFQDLLVLAAELLRENEDVRRDLGERYRRLLVDEFQDTDPLQAEIVMLLASEPAGSGRDGAEEARPESASSGEVGSREAGSGPTESTSLEAAWRTAIPRPGALFVVGDPKQSIYRFRRADIQLYALVKARFDAFGEVLRLTTNFRSRPPIGDLVNEHFPADGFFPQRATPEQAAFEPLNTRPPDVTVPGEGVFTYEVTPSRKAQAAAAEDDAVRLASWVRQRIDAGERGPGDFMILTRNRTHLESYARALEAYGLPVQVTGAGVGVEEEIRELIVVLECMVDPGNAVKVVASLVGLFFGLDYERLLGHRLEGGGFDAMRPGDRGDPAVLEALGVLHRWWRRSTDTPADVFVSGLTSELGLLPLAAAGELASLRTGALVYALGAVRAAVLAGDASLPRAVEALEAALDLSEAEAPLEPGQPDVVRLMNLHQAKGLEARVVVLADPSGGRPHAAEMHVERKDDGTALGYVHVTEAREGYRDDRPLAHPADWHEKEATEVRFDAAEEVRLLYVAVTRAAEELLVVRWPEGKDSAWQGLHAWLDERATPLDLQPSPPPARERLATTVAEVERVVDVAKERRASQGEPSYRHVSVTELAKGSELRRGSVASDATERSAPDEGVYRGYSWGSAVHGALAAAAESPPPGALRATCRDLLVQHERPLDDHGEPVELDELLALVRSVRASELWRRAGEAERLLAEVPFAARDVGFNESVDADDPPVVRARRQLELFGGEEPAPSGERPTDPEGEDGRQVEEVLEGVIDLVFKEPDGWVIADYKTDVGTDPDFRERTEAYRRQVDLYAAAWTRLTGEPVKERVLFFTSQGRTVTW